MSSLENKTVSEVNEAIAVELALVNADSIKFAGGTSAAATRVRGSYMAIMKLCKEGRDIIMNANRALKETRKASKGSKVPNRQLK